MGKREFLRAGGRPQLADNGSFIVSLRDTLGVFVLGAIAIYLLIALERAHQRERELLRERITSS